MVLTGSYRGYFQGRYIFYYVLYFFMIPFQFSSLVPYFHKCIMRSLWISCWYIFIVFSGLQCSSEFLVACLKLTCRPKTCCITVRIDDLHTFSHFKSLVHLSDHMFLLHQFFQITHTHTHFPKSRGVGLTSPKNLLFKT